MKRDRPYILFIEEDPLLADVTGFRLELLGYEVKLVQTGEDALEAVRASAPDLMIIDLVLPDMDALDLISRFSDKAETNEIPILILSIEADLDAVQRAYNAGANDYLVAPYNPAVLEDKVETLLTHSKSRM